MIEDEILKRSQKYKNALSSLCYRQGARAAECLIFKRLQKHYFWICPDGSYSKMWNITTHQLLSKKYLIEAYQKGYILQECYIDLQKNNILNIEDAFKPIN